MEDLLSDAVLLALLVAGALALAWAVSQNRSAGRPTKLRRHRPF